MGGRTHTPLRRNAADNLGRGSSLFVHARPLAKILATQTLNLAYKVGLYRILSTLYGGQGVIFSLHRVIEANQQAFNPHQKIGADVLDELLGTVRRLGWEIVSIDEVHRRLTVQKDQDRRSELERGRFACFTFDDGYVDNLTLALPLFRKHQAPLCLFAATGLIERELFYWWGANEDLVLRSDRIELPATDDSGPRVLWARDSTEKVLAYRALDELCHKSGAALFPTLRQLYYKVGINPHDSLDRDALTPSQVREMASDPLVTIGSHSVTHERLSPMTEEAVRFEMQESRRKLENWSGTNIRHFAYPFGRSDACGAREFAIAKQSGFKTAVTTRQGNIFAEHSNYLECLPRRSIPISQFGLRNVLFGVQTVVQNDCRFQTN